MANDTATSPTTPTPAATSAELRGTISRVRWHCPEGSGRVILDVTDADGKTVAVIGRLDGHPQGWIHHEVHILGKWQQHERHGRQLQADVIARAEPRTKDGVVRFLREALGHTPATAQKLWTRWKERTPEVMRTDPRAVAATGLMTIEMARSNAFVLERLARRQESLLSLSALFAGRRLPIGLAQACVDRWRTHAVQVVRTDPYVLMTFPALRIGFARADALYLEMGGNPHRLKRQLLYLIHAIETNRDGHTWMRAVDLGVELSTELQRRGAALPRIVDAIKLGLRTARLARRRDAAGTLWITTTGAAQDEADVADKGLRMLSALAPI